MNIVNHCFFKGNLTADPELKLTDNNNKFVNVCIGVNERYKQGEEFKTKTNFIYITFWNKQAERAYQLKKGDYILFTGKYAPSEGEKEGVKITYPAFTGKFEKIEPIKLEYNKPIPPDPLGEFK